MTGLPPDAPEGARGVSHRDGPRGMRVLIAPDSFKGSLSSVEVAAHLRAGWLRARPGDIVHLAPLADGGEGTLDAIEATGGWDRMTATVTDPIGRRIAAPWLRSADGERAVLEMAAASGLSRLRPHELDPVGSTSRGTGELVRAALDAGVRRIALGIGGSATTDGGRGLLEGLGATVREGGPSDGPSGGPSDGPRRGPSGGPSDGPSGGLVGGRAGGSVDLSGLDPRLAETHLRVACDVTNPLLGPHGAAAVYGPQKGASPVQVAELDARNSRWADALEAACGCDERATAGAGAAGGVGFALLCLADRFRSFAFRPGVELVMETVAFDDRLRLADLVITGEGRIDAQTAFGKTALGVARRAREAGVRCIAVGGGVTPEGVEALRPLGATVVPVWEEPVSLEVAMAAGGAPLERCGERLADLVSREGGRPR